MTPWLYLCNDLGIPVDGTKGASEHVRAITRALSSVGVDVNILAARGRLPENHPAHQIPSPCGDSARRLGDRVRSWLAVNDAPAGMGSELSQLVYDAALTHELTQTDLVPAVGAVIERLSLFSTAGRAFARHRGVPYLIEMNSPMADEAAKYREAGLQALAQQIERTTLRAADAVMTVSNELRRHVIENVGLQPDRVTTVPNGVEIELFSKAYDRKAAREEARVPEDAVVFGFVGSLKQWHGIDVLLRAFGDVLQMTRKAHLLIIGEGRTVQSLQVTAEEHGVSEHLTWRGGVDHSTVARLLAAVDVAVAPYLPLDTFYFSPLKLYEYMAAGLCTIASRAGQIAEIIEDGHNGLLATAGDAGSLADAMIRLAGDAGLRSRLGAQAQRSVQHCGWNQTAERIVELVREVSRRRSQPLAEVAP